MSYRLRRVIGINIRNAKSRQPSAQLPVLDLREHTLAVGPNGVGKSTFLRLIPLFYGASPERILRGSGKHNLIGHVLPTSSSAVAYEYERESEEDLRLAVMYAQPGKDRPEFMIIESGFRKEFFVDNGYFVDRDQFKDRIEKDMGLVVTERLDLHEYRAVILNERRGNKESRKHRVLAVRHSIAPAGSRSLFGLDTIAVTLTSEKLSFRDLQSLVLERLNDSGAEGQRGSNERSLRKSRASISDWLQSVAHTQKVFDENRTPRRKLKELTMQANDLALKLGSLRVATERSIQQRADEVDKYDADGKRHAADHERFLQETQSDRERLQATQRQAKALVDVTRAPAEAAHGQLKHFMSVKADELELEAGRHDGYVEELTAKTGELKAFQDLAGAAAREAGEWLGQRKQAIAAQLEGVLDAVRIERDAVRNRINAAVDEHDQAREAVEQAHEQEGKPAHIAAMEHQVGDMQNEIGSQQTLASTAPAPDDARNNLIQRENEARDCQVQLNAAHTALAGARQASVEAKAAQDELIGKQERAASAVERARDRHTQLQEQFSPQPGTLLAALRTHPPALWADAAKVLDPALLARTDLQPSLDDVADSLQAPGRLQMGTLHLAVAPIDPPEWADETASRERLDEAAQELSRARQALDALEGQSASVRAKTKDAEQALHVAAHRVNAGTEALAAAGEAVERAKRHVDVELRRVRNEHKAQAERLRGQLRTLSSDLSMAQSQLVQTRAGELNRFKFEIGRLREELKRAEGGLDKREQDARNLAAVGNREAQGQHDQRLAGAGIDAHKMSALEARINDLATLLNAITANAHIVAAWKEFSIKVLPTMHDLDDALAKATAAHKDAGDNIERHESKARERDAHFKKEAARISNLLTQAKDEHEKLLALLDSRLKIFRSYGADVPGEGMHGELEDQTRRARAALDRCTANMESSSAELQRILREHPGAIQNWTDNKRAEYDRRVMEIEANGHSESYLPHERARDWARDLLDWFEPLSHHSHFASLRSEMEGCLNVADAFLAQIDTFENKVKELNREFQTALKQVQGFNSFDHLDITISSSAAKAEGLSTLRKMRDANRAQFSSRGVLVLDASLPTEAETNLLRQFRDSLPDTGMLQVKLDELVSLKCSVVAQGELSVVESDRDMDGLSSTGLNLLIKMMILLGFVGIVRGPESRVGLTWLIDEVSRVDSENMGQTLQILDHQMVKCIAATPDFNPTLAARFRATQVFEPDTSISIPDVFESEDIFDEDGAGESAERPALEVAQ
jgi:chromosome segregation ATPase